MATMNVSLPDAMKNWVEERSRSGRYSNASDYVRDLIRRDQDRTEKVARMQSLVDEAAASGDGQRSMNEIEREARARLTASE
ncbi:MAG: type II toxin-antitoxin system ParD family antitoxin [Xanthomonadales bacterium]|nr:type II toxin-antitoxin system ParD family antitoxin [Xanthomonadales bacterium]|tara:strand:+ start:1948 stop:2193 length:246 start_codon:yes stop_codon:yes gene_type:complete